MPPLLASLMFLQVQVRDEPKDWKLLETPNFNLYYPLAELEPRAKEFAAWFELSRKELVPAMGIEPEKVNVFLYRSYFDLIQASFFGSPRAQPLDRRIRAPALKDPPKTLRSLVSTLDRKDCAACRMNAKSRALAISEPERNRIFIHCQGSDRWNYWFIKHELAHQFQFELLFPLRVPSWLIALKDPTTPQWWWEGGADYWAGIFDSEKDEFVRDLADERLYDLKELFSPDILNFYDYLAIYYEGSYFWRFLDEQYGAGTGKRLFQRTARGLPLASQKPLQHVVGKDRVEIEREFNENLRKKWAPILEGRTAPTDRLTDSRYYYRRRSWGGRWSPDGKHLANVGDVDTWPELYIDGVGQFGIWRGITTGFANSRPSWSPDGKRLAVIEWWMNQDHLVLVNLEGGWETIKLPELDELYDPEWSPDGKKIALAALKEGTSDIWILNLEDRKLERMTTDHGNSEPTWSKDGRLAWIHEDQGHTILVVDKKPVTTSWALLQNPEWTPDGTKILVAADVGGVYDAFEVDPATGKAKRLTKFRGGVSYPSYHPTDGTLLITYFQGRGNDLYRVKPAPQDEPGFDEEARKPWYDPFKKPPPQGTPAEKTRVWGVNWLMFPVTSESLILPGLEFSFGDRDGESTLSLLGYGVSNHAYGAVATVANTRYRPTVGALGGGSKSGGLFEAIGEPFVEVPLLPTLTTGAGWIERYREEDDSNLPQNPRFFDSGPTVSARFSDEIPVHLHDWEWGFAFGGSASFFNEHYGGDRRLDDYFTFLEGSTDILGQDYLLWLRCIYERMVGREFLSDELLKIGAVVRGARSLKGIEEYGASFEFRFPICRDFLWKPLEVIGLGEWLILKDLRGFVFGDLGYVASEVGSLVQESYWAYSTGVGLRLDFSFMLWPIVNLRVPTRVEFWWAFVGQQVDPHHGAVGASFVVGF